MARKDKPEKILKIHMKPAPRLGEDAAKVQQKTDGRLATMGGIDRKSSKSNAENERKRRVKEDNLYASHQCEQLLDPA